MKKILCLVDNLENVSQFVKDAQLLLFPIEQLDPEEHSFSTFEEIYLKLKEQTDLSEIDFVVAEFIESLPLVYFMRKDGFFCPAFFIPHTNAYPFNILFYFLLLSELSHPGDKILCGSSQATYGYSHFVNIKALPVCTFGIKRTYQRGSQSEARRELGLPEDSKIILYTGRFMNDKGLSALIDICDNLKQSVQNTLLVLSVTHFDPHYYNLLAGRLRDAVIFYRLEPSQMVNLYQAADLFVSLATSVFETYGKSPMEAISCGVPAILPDWDGFRYYINDQNGALANVVYTDAVEEAPYSFACVDLDDFTAKAHHWLTRKMNSDYCLPEWAYYDHTMETISRLLKETLSQHARYFKPPKVDLPIDFSKYPQIIHDICSHYGFTTCKDLEIKADELGLINRDDPGDLGLLREFHDQLFRAMERV